jgi:hypothetical protein
VNPDGQNLPSGADPKGENNDHETSVGGKPMSTDEVKPQCVVVSVPEAKGKRIRHLCIEEPYPTSTNVYVSINFEDDTVVVIDLTPRVMFSVDYLRRIDGELKSLREYPKRILRR